MIDVIVKCKKIKLLEDNMGEILGDLGFADEILDINNYNFDFIRIKNLCSGKTVIRE